MNFSDSLERFLSWQKKQLDDMLQYNEDKMYLLDVDWMTHSDFALYMQAFVQPPLSFLYLFILVFLSFVLVKEKMMGFVQVILLLSNGVVIIQLVVAAPLLFVFFGLFDRAVPIPYPWCAMIIVIESNVKNIVRLTAIYLKVLLAVNRVCSVYYPFKYKIWFTKKRCAIYCLFTLAVSSTIGVSINFTFQRFTKKSYFDEIWGTFQTYDTCSIAPSEFEGSVDAMVFISHFVELTLSVFGLLGIGVCNFLLIKRLIKTKLERKALRGAESQYEKAMDARMDLLNRMSIWVLLSSFLCEIPTLVTYAFNVYDDVLVLVLNNIMEDKHRVYLHAIHTVQYVLMTPLDLAIYIIMSKKTRKAIKRRLRMCC